MEWRGEGDRVWFWGGGGGADRRKKNVMDEYGLTFDTFKPDHRSR